MWYIFTHQYDGCISQYCRIFALKMTHLGKHNLGTTAALPVMRRAYALPGCGAGVRGGSGGVSTSDAELGEAVGDQ
jgi:hypothetical protein